MNKLLAIASLLLSFHLAGCAAQSIEGEESPENAAAAEQTGAQESALDNGSGGLHHYTCSGLRCDCTGDADCNDMFGSGVCGDVAQCDNTTDPPTCWCFKALRVSLSKSAITGAKTKLDTAP